MGNCVGIAKKSAMEEHEQDDDFWRLDDGPENQIFTGEKQGFDHVSDANGKELKIKISKKQLMEILGRVHVEKMPLEKLLAQLMKNDLGDLKNQPWKPSLQSIPEVN